MIRLSVFPAEDLPRKEWARLTGMAESWYGTPGHCLLYARAPAEWTALWSEEGEDPVAACFFSARRWMRKGRQVHLGGPTSASFGMLKELMSRERAQVLTVPYGQGSSRERRLPWWKGTAGDYPSDWIVDLPPTYDAYRHTLGKTSRRHLTSYVLRFQRELTTRRAIVEGPDIGRELVSDLIALHRRRWEGSGKEYTFTPDVISRRARLAKECGLFCGRWEQNRLVGGTLNYIHGSTAYLSLVAHDPDYDRLHAGLVCLMDTIEHLIARGVREYNLHVRYSPFKTRIGGMERKHHEITLFANPLAAVLWHSRRAADRLKSRVGRSKSSR